MMTTQRMDTVGASRGGRMSRQRKRDAVLRLLRVEDLDTVSRSLGVAAATLRGWRDAFLDGVEASLATKPMDGEERESDRLKARLREMLLESELLEHLAGGQQRPFGGAGGRGDEPDVSPGSGKPYGLARVCRTCRPGRAQRSGLWVAASHTCLLMCGRRSSPKTGPTLVCPLSAALSRLQVGAAAQ
jgi:transposase